MSYRKQGLAILFATIILGFISVDAAFAQISCSDVKRSNPNYYQKMDELAKRAGLSGNYWSRYHEAVVSDLCDGDIRGVDHWVNDGFVKPKEAQDIARVLGKSYRSKRRSEKGKSYGYSRERFLEMGACSACADNTAQYYTRKPNSRCGKLAKKALEGDPEAIEKLLAFPAYCEWK